MGEGGVIKLVCWEQITFTLIKFEIGSFLSPYNHPIWNLCSLFQISNQNDFGGKALSAVERVPGQHCHLNVSHKKSIFANISKTKHFQTIFCCLSFVNIFTFISTRQMLRHPTVMCARMPTSQMSPWPAKMGAKLRLTESFSHHRANSSGDFMFYIKCTFL